MPVFTVETTLPAPPPEPQNATAGVAFLHVPSHVVLGWGERDFLIVFGIPSVDLDERRRRRDLQRSTCWQFPGVATRRNNFSGAMLVLYVLAQHPLHNYTYSAEALKEVAEWHDVVTLAMNEGSPTTTKRVGGRGFWGNEAEIGMSRKTFMWFDLAYRMFPNVSYIAKGDDDMFIRVPQYLADLRSLPRHGLYWGFFVRSTVQRGETKFRFRYAAGTCMTLARDVVHQFVSYKPLQRLVHLPYSREREAEFFSLNMNHEDMMVGRVLAETRYPNLVVALEGWCRFHNVHVGIPIRPVTQYSVVVHHLWESEYSMFMRRFGKDVAPGPYRFRRNRKGLIRFICDRRHLR
ncbi:putative UDP-Gal or UDP-GlcNAc-dependent glycosyltransferase [Trypanosoma grayi]|uniref:putative UDP-Gal or UDP-GlcNAc-dependent glycosyltransferase n=1 Tax=Trypanosoma grayi TaxID=71804 RepID=UPI0004F4A3F3|nr:putative UDP-Gal or UDP-GlcNAc-dependent glycosyltransferase [Trypanosoma grayi]KEG15190.1 putative UDP-Gal or UDP-GlcNAc-dependent glycosyltransferase [Trypanosoma grayi]